MIFVCTFTADFPQPALGLFKENNPSQCDYYTAPDSSSSPVHFDWPSSLLPYRAGPASVHIALRRGWFCTRFHPRSYFLWICKVLSCIFLVATPCVSLKIWQLHNASLLNNSAVRGLASESMRQTNVAAPCSGMNEHFRRFQPLYRYVMPCWNPSILSLVLRRIQPWKTKVKHVKYEAWILSNHASVVKC